MRYTLYALFASAACLCSVTLGDILVNAHPDSKYGEPIPFEKAPGTCRRVDMRGLMQVSAPWRPPLLGLDVPQQ